MVIIVVVMLVMVRVMVAMMVRMVVAMMVMAMMVVVVVVVAHLHPLLPPVHSPSVHIKVNHKQFLILKTGCIHSGHVKDIVVGVVCPVEEWVPCEVVAIFLAEPGRADVAAGGPHLHLEAIVAMGLRQRLKLVVHIPQVVRVCHGNHQLIEVDVGVVQESIPCRVH